jgi:DNA invertase Pin-like site-specific DNA recombinase
MLIGYARVSTHDQDCALQEDALKAAGCEQVFLETASGAKRDRPELLAALAAMKTGDTLVVWRLDRLARSLRHLLETIEGLEAHGMKFRSLTEAMDTSTSGGKLILSVLGAIAEFERALISERTKAGLEAARLRGRKGGRPRKSATPNDAPIG